jgi:hypothetical protein
VNPARPESLGELMGLFYETFLALYGDEDLASAAAAEMISRIIASRDEEDTSTVVAEA